MINNQESNSMMNNQQYSINYQESNPMNNNQQNSNNNQDSSPMMNNQQNSNKKQIIFIDYYGFIFFVFILFSNT